MNTLLPLLFSLCLLGAFFFWLIMLIDCVRKESDQGNTKIVWIIIIVFTNILGALLYFFIRRPERQYPSSFRS